MYIHHHSLHYLQYLQTLKGKLVASLTIRDFVFNMSSIFIPAYLYSFGYSPLFIAGYYLAYHSIAFFSYDLVARVISRYGIYHALFISYVTSSIAVGLLAFADQSPVFVYAAFLPLMFSEKLFWPARHIDIARLFSGGKTMKHTSSVLQTINMFVAGIAPLFGGLVAAQYGPGAALIIAFVIMLMAIGMLWSEYVKERGEPVISTFSPKFTRAMIGNAAMNLQMVVAGLMWPLFIFLVLGDFSDIGLIFSITYAVGMLLTYASGNWFEKFPYFRIGTFFKIISFPLRAIATSFSLVFMVDLVGSVGSGFMDTRYTARYYNQAKHSGDIDSYIFSVEKAGEIGKFAVWLLLFLLIAAGLSIKAALIVCFMVAAVSVPFAGLMGSAKEE